MTRGEFTGQSIQQRSHGVELDPKVPVTAVQIIVSLNSKSAEGNSRYFRLVFAAESELGRARRMDLAANISHSCLG